MRIGHTLPPAAAPIYLRDIISGLKGLVRGNSEIERFRDELKSYFNVKHCFLLYSGKAALTIVLKALHELHPDRDQVLIPAFTCYSVPSAIVRAGLKVRLCDIDPDTLDFDFRRLSEILSPSPPSNGSSSSNDLNNAKKLLCVIPTHLFGLPADVKRVRSLVQDSNIVVVEDAAQAMGSERDGRKLGTLGDVGFFSLGRGKALSAVEGGIALTNRDDMAAAMKMHIEALPHCGVFDVVGLLSKAIALSFLIHPSLFWLPKSLTFLKLGETIYDPYFRMGSMSAFQAGLAKGWDEKLETLKTMRVRMTKQWASIATASYLHHYVPEHGSYPHLIRFPVRIDDAGIRKGVLEESNRHGLGIMATFPSSVDGIHRLPGRFHGQKFPVAKDHADKLITLPINSFVSPNDQSRIAGLILKGM